MTLTKTTADRGSTPLGSTTLGKTMADKNDKWHDNVGGFKIIAGKKVSFYVDRECILCSVCSDCAPKNFKVSDDGDHDFVYKQPENEEELESCYEAMENCPVEAIGDDGE